VNKNIYIFLSLRDKELTRERIGVKKEGARK
jgi:hypothetical protein